MSLTPNSWRNDMIIIGGSNPPRGAKQLTQFINKKSKKKHGKTI